MSCLKTPKQPVGFFKTPIEHKTLSRRYDCSESMLFFKLSIEKEPIVSRRCDSPESKLVFENSIVDKPSLQTLYGVQDQQQTPLYTCRDGPGGPVIERRYMAYRKVLHPTTTCHAISRAQDSVLHSHILHKWGRYAAYRTSNKFSKSCTPQRLAMPFQGHRNPSFIHT